VLGLLCSVVFALDEQQPTTCEDDWSSEEEFQRTRTVRKEERGRPKARRASQSAQGGDYTATTPFVSRMELRERARCAQQDTFGGNESSDDCGKYGEWRTIEGPRPDRGKERALQAHIDRAEAVEEALVVYDPKEASGVADRRSLPEEARRERGSRGGRAGKKHRAARVRRVARELDEAIRQAEFEEREAQRTLREAEAGLQEAIQLRRCAQQALRDHWVDNADDICPAEAAWPNVD
jgi:hypothetical protein